jgi:polyhydroxybutyrate depolymerase
MRARPITFTPTALATSLAMLAGWGCSGNSGEAAVGNGGGPTSGGAQNGGQTNQTSANTGGATTTGGAQATGGARVSGGTSAGLGGAATTGGSAPLGGASNTGGTADRGGATSGGTTSTGGKLATGGATTSGGITSTGGRPATGGASTAGGASTTTGGSNATGGKASGGTSPTGGSNTTGGKSVGGGSSTGGAAIGGNGAGGAATGGNANGGGSSTCPTPALTSGDSTKKITVGGLSREYILHVPSGYTGNAAVPLVVDFHPIGGSDTAWRSGSPYPAVIDKEGVISAFPNGTASPNMGNAWNVQGCCTTVDDVAFAKALVTDVEKVACIDVKRVYAVGFSMGGGMSHYLGCHAADVFAAVGPASFDLTQQNEAGCTPTRPITVISWRGKNDNVVAYAGGHSALVTGMAIDFLGAVGTFQKWASIDGCTGSASAADSDNCQTYSQCSAGVQVTLCTNNSGGHEAAKASVVWPMLKKYTMP